MKEIDSDWVPNKDKYGPQYYSSWRHHRDWAPTHDTSRKCISWGKFSPQSQETTEATGGNFWSCCLEKTKTKKEVSLYPDVEGGEGREQVEEVAEVEETGELEEEVEAEAA